MIRSVGDALARALANCLHPRVLWLSLLPVLLACGLTLLMGYLYWEPATDAIARTLSHWSLVTALQHALDLIGLGRLTGVLTPLVVVALALPLMVITALVLVSLLTAPAVVRWVVARRFAGLQALGGQGATIWHSAARGIGLSLLALLALLCSLPFWLIPPLALVLPALIWGWLTAQLMGFDVLAQHANRFEREALLRQHRRPLLAMGVMCGLLGTVPAMLFGLGAQALIMAPLVAVAAVWLYTLIFVFSALWFAHYALQALHHERGKAPVVDVVARPVPGRLG